MFKLLKRMHKREIGMAFMCALFILAQIYFDLRLPDYMSELTVLIQSANNDLSSVLNTGIKMLGCVAGSAILCIICAFLSSKIASGFTRDVRSDLFNHIVHLGEEEMNKFSIPSLITRTTNDITQIQMVISMGLQNIVKAPVMAIWAIIKILGKSWELSLVTAGFVVIILTCVIAIFSKVMPRFRIVQKLTDKINKVARENLTGINVVHAFNGEQYQNDKFDTVNDEMFNTQFKNQTLMAWMQPIMQFGMNALTLCIYWLGAYLLMSVAASDMMGRVTLFSNIVVFSSYASYVVMSFMMLVMIFMMLPAAQISAERINEVLNTKPIIKEGNVHIGKEEGSVEFKNVSFTYPNSNDSELNDISFKVNKGETLAIIGATGSGKTTLIDLIVRFYDATKGEVLVDGVNVKDYAFDSLYNRVAYIPQKAILFNGTINENIKFGQCIKEVNQLDIDKAIEIAQGKEFVDGLVDKTNYHIAQSGKNVSGGQKQRLSIARALARNSEIIIFDDSFSALDYKTDAALRMALNNNLKDTTKIIVAQRVSTIRHADQILVLDEGRIVGKGSHEELMKNCQIYQEIANSQLSQAELA